MKKLVVMLTTLVILTGCAQLGQPAPATFRQRVVVAYSTAELVARGATVARQAGKLGEKDKDNVIKTTQTAVDDIGIAEALYLQKPQAGEEKLVVTIRILQALQDYLKVTQ